MADYISGNRYLSKSEMEVNARIIYSYLKQFGMTSNAICAMLGNMETESTINPGIYENLDSSSTTNGFGLVQWTPNTKFKNWVDENDFNVTYDNIYIQCERIVHELGNGIQYYPTDKYPMTATEFALSNKSPEYLAQVFLINYERPKDQNQPNRSTQARYWYDLLDGSPVIDPDDPDIPGGGGGGTSTKKKKGYKFVLFRRRGIYG